MAEVFISKVRPIGTSLGVLIPNRVVLEEALKAGSEVRVSIVSPNFKLLEQLMGSMKGALPFARDRRARI